LFGSAIINHILALAYGALARSLTHSTAIYIDRSGNALFWFLLFFSVRGVGMQNGLILFYVFPF